MSSTDSARVRATLRRLYRDVDGFEIAEREERRVERVKSSPTYGEIMPAATVQLIDALELQRKDVFVDLGSGVGKVVVAAALRSGVGRAVGVELARDRHQRAVGVVSRGEAEGLWRPGVVELRNEDVLRTALHDATVLYTCSTAFPYAFTERLARRVQGLGRVVRFITLQELDSDVPGFALDSVLRLDMTWARKRKVHVYSVSP
ncbi:MAG: hypothetical protein ACE37F_22895 [Nannocystaceae bacterium]|nr:hypothetical protein [bacterium]